MERPKLLFCAALAPLLLKLEVWRCGRTSSPSTHLWRVAFQVKYLKRVIKELMSKREASILFALNYI